MEQYQKIIFTEWSSENSVLTTRLSGLVNEDDVQLWINGFVEAYHKIPMKSSFKLFSNLHGFKAVNIAAHKMMREIVPQFLADHGIFPGYAKLFPEVPVNVSVLDDRLCIKCAHVHHDDSKISRYRSELANEKENYFTDQQEGWNWLMS